MNKIPTKARYPLNSISSPIFEFYVYATEFEHQDLPALEIFIIKEMPVLTNLPRMPKTLKYLVINECPLITTEQILDSLEDAENIEIFMGFSTSPFPRIAVNKQFLKDHLNLSDKHH